MVHDLTRKWLLRATGLTLGVAIAIASASTSARADDDDELPDTKLFRQLLQSLGLRGGGGDIDYRERSPLVVPPNRELPPPVTGSISERNPAWPADPDQKRRKDAKAKRSQPTNAYRGDSAMADHMNPLRPNEMRSNRPGVIGGTSADDNRAANRSEPLRPSELGGTRSTNIFSSLFNSKEGEYGTFTGETPRTSLIEPPPGYRTPSPTQPYGVGKERWTAPTVDRLLPTR